MAHDVYENPLISRYASPQMAALWSDRTKFRTWRQLWVWLAEAQAELGLPITAAQLDQLRAHVDDIDFAAAARYEKQLRHDVMAHVHAYGDTCPEARGIIHWGATSCYVTDNADLILLREALRHVSGGLAAVIDALAEFARQYRDLPCLAFTHLQPAQPTTVGKRACLWAYDLALDLEEMQRRCDALLARGVKGTTGTQASFLALFQGDHQKVRALDRLVAQKMGFEATYTITGQTYTRKIDAQILAALTGIAQSAHKAATDLRLLQSRREMEEPFESSQVGSSAMPYKRNPMRSERICALARFVMGLEPMAAQTAAVQWMERTLDDSAIRRLVLPQAFLATDALLRLYLNVARGLVVYPQVIRRNLEEELPFMATENLLMQAVAAGGDRQALHERIRQHSHAAAAAVKQGQPNDLLARLRRDPELGRFATDEMLDGRRYVGRAPEQVDEFLAEVVQPIRARYAAALAQSAEIHV